MAFIIFAIFLGVFLNNYNVCGNTYSVKIGTESHVNTIDSRFLSFTIDPKYLFSSTEKYRSKECICMASSLTPAYIRIAGPSTASLSFHNDTIAIEHREHPPKERTYLEDISKGRGFLADPPRRVKFQDSFADDLSKEMRGRWKNSVEIYESRFKRNHERIEVSHTEWRRFVQWAKTTGFDLVFALNNAERTAGGLWDPNTALNILTVAERAHVGDIYWQLGYECQNQSIEEYLNDLETLGVITETFAAGRAGQWKVVGGDVTPCLHADSKSDFKDYVTLSNDLMDAILLNGNSSTQELERMSPRARSKLLQLLSQSSTPLWLAEAPWSSNLDEVSRAADWLTGLGHAARNGFSHHFRELGEEMYQPSLSFYMALLFKNLVGSKVLDVEMEPDQAIMFAHCTSLRHKAVPGAVTLYAVNMDEEPARFSVKLDRKEEGGDVMQFILGHDSNGNIQVNGKPMYFEGDLKPVVKRVRPYKTLLLNLPARSFGFWVLANTKINACFDEENATDSDYVEAETVESIEKDRLKAKRSVLHKELEDSQAEIEFIDDSESIEEVNNENLLSRISNINQDLNKVQELYKDKPKTEKRLKRELDLEGIRERIQKKLKNRGLLLRKHMKNDKDPKGEENKNSILRLPKRNITRRFRKDRLGKITKLSKNKVSKRNSKASKTETILARTKYSKITERPRTCTENHGTVIEKSVKVIEKPRKDAEKLTEEHSAEKSAAIKVTEAKSRKRRNVDKDQVELSVDENEIEVPKDNVKLWKILRKIHKQLKDLSEENEDYIEENTSKTHHNKDHHHHHNLKEEGEDVVLEGETGFIKTTVGNLMRVLSDLNKNLNRFWTGIKLLD